MTTMHSHNLIKQFATEVKDGSFDITNLDNLKHDVFWQLVGDLLGSDAVGELLLDISRLEYKETIDRFTDPP